MDDIKKSLYKLTDKGRRIRSRLRARSAAALTVHRTVIHSRRFESPAQQINGLIFRSVRWQGQKDSNPQQRFWRPTCYLYTMPLCSATKNIIHASPAFVNSPGACFSIPVIEKASLENIRPRRLRERKSPRASRQSLHHVIIRGPAPLWPPAAARLPPNRPSPSQYQAPHPCRGWNSPEG